MSKVAVLFMGKMRAGKSTGAEAISRLFTECINYSLAGLLKELHYNFIGNEDKDREWLQNMGSACRDTFGEDFWVNELVKLILFDQPACLTVDDVRYDNELEILTGELENMGYDVVPVFVSVSRDTQVSRGAELEFGNHVSEGLAHQMELVINGESERSTPKRLCVVNGDRPIDEYTKEVLETVVLEATSR